jgi:hypothetical protein
MSFNWNRKLLKYHAASALRPDANTALLQGLAKAALDTRAGRANDRHNVPVFLQYAVGVNFALNLNRLETVLELGSGYSSLLWGTLAPEGTRIFSVDGKPVDAYDIREPLLAVAHRVRFVTGPTLTREQYRAFYDSRTRTEFLGLPVAALRAHLGPFVRPQGRSFYAATLGLPEEPGALARAVDGQLFRGDGLRCLSTLLPERWKADEEFCAAQGPTALDGVLAEADSFDAVFYDCGEFSTLPEWTLTSQRIRPGGLAILHDVHFPKSVKSFLLCAMLAASPEWDVLYHDTTTPQGLCIARRR